MTYKIGTVGIVGRPNAGKSSLINALIHEKVSIVSPKPQTTRNSIIGMLSTSNYKITFIDTPGIHTPNDSLGSFMNKSVFGAISDVDALLVLIDGSKPITEDTLKFVNRFKTKPNVILVITKTDITTFERLYPQLDKLNKLDFVKEIIPISSHKNRNLDVLINNLLKYLPEDEKTEDEDDYYTNRSVKFMASEIIREKALLCLDQEIPHGVAVLIERWCENEESGVTNIDAIIYCERDTHKGIIIGKNGEKLKQIGTLARKDIQKLIGAPVYLNLFVKVEKNWKNNIAILNRIGYNDSDLDF